MRNWLSIALAVTVLSMTSFAERPAEHHPETFLGFLKPDMHVGVKFEPGTTNVSLSIYDAELYAVALDITSSRGEFVKAESLATKHKIVRARLDAHIAKLSHPVPDEARNEIQVYPLRGYFVGTVLSVGNDYVQVEYVRHTSNEEKKVRVVLNKASIARIYLDLDPITFTSS